MSSEACPACGFRVFARGYGSYEVCPICDWEDDGQLANPTSGGGANAESLADMQTEVLRRFPVECSRHGQFHRDPAWRPLNAREIAAFEEKRTIEHWHTPGITSDRDVYWHVDGPPDE
jgi:hypothetical protein